MARTFAVDHPAWHAFLKLRFRRLECRAHRLRCFNADDDELGAASGNARRLIKRGSQRVVKNRTNGAYDRLADNPKFVRK